VVKEVILRANVLHFLLLLNLVSTKDKFLAEAVEKKTMNIYEHYE
jgi:hypothetical protein